MVRTDWESDAGAQHPARPFGGAGQGESEKPLDPFQPRLTGALALPGQFEIETSQLKASEIGKIVLFYTKHPKLDPSITRMADQLVSESNMRLSMCLPLSVGRALTALFDNRPSELDATLDPPICSHARPSD
jgi:hypothetical protein